MKQITTASSTRTAQHADDMFVSYVQCCHLANVAISLKNALAYTQIRFRIDE